MDTGDPSTQQDGQKGWQTLAVFSLPSLAGNERQAMVLVEQAVDPLCLPVEKLDRLKTAVAEATMNAIEHGNRHQADLPVTICVLTEGNRMSVEITDYGTCGPIPAPETPDVEAKLDGRQTSRGWGFFLIEKMVDALEIHGDEAHHTIKLYLYLEGRADQDLADCSGSHE